MKLKYIFLAIIGAATMGACSDNENEIPTPKPNNENAEVSLSIGVDNGAIYTKADVDPYEKSGEANINRLAIFLFDKTTGDVVAKKDTVKKTTSSPSLDRIGNVIVKLGTYHIIIVANADADIMNITSMADLDAYQGKLTSQNQTSPVTTSNNMLMASQLYKDVQLKALNVDGLPPVEGDELARMTYNYLGENKAIEADKDARPVTASWYKAPTTTAIPLTRLAARVQVESVGVKFKEDLVGGKFEIKDIFIVNVRPTTRVYSATGKYEIKPLGAPYYYRGAPATVDIKDKLIYPAAEAVPSTNNIYIQPISYGDNRIADGGTMTYSKFPFWYVFENQTGENAEEGFYNTRVVISGYVITPAGVKQPLSYYPILIREMTGDTTYDLIQRNVVYNIKAVIGGLGSDNPDKIMENAMISATVTAEPWKVVIHEEWIDDEE